MSWIQRCITLRGGNEVRVTLPSTAPTLTLSAPYIYAATNPKPRSKWEVERTHRKPIKPITHLTALQGAQFIRGSRRSVAGYELLCAFWPVHRCSKIAQVALEQAHDVIRAGERGSPQSIATPHLGQRGGMST